MISFYHILNKKLKIKIETKKKGTEKKDTEKEHIKKVNDKNSFEDTNNKPATNDNIKAHIKDEQKLIKQRFKSLLKTKKSIKSNIDLVHISLKKLPNKLHPKLIELIRLDTMPKDSINIVWREIYDRERKTF